MDPVKERRAASTRRRNVNKQASLNILRGLENKRIAVEGESEGKRWSRREGDACGGKVGACVSWVERKEVEETTSVEILSSCRHYSRRLAMEAG